MMAENMKRNSVFFDAKDYELLQVINRYVKADCGGQPSAVPKMFTLLHPHGIKEMAVSQELRIALSVVHLLNSLEIGMAGDRILALQSLHDEVLYSAATSFRRNTGRVLIQIMKELIRSCGDEKAQLRLAHDFRQTASGRPRIVRKMLRRYALLEMPEDWSQLAFDHHVHDANTKGRKTATHLVMDAWIKGIRVLNVVYYNFITSSAVWELLQAAEIMGIEVRVGIEFMAQFRGRFVQFIWEPKGFAGSLDMQNFLEENSTKQLMRVGREASQYHQRFVISLLEHYNAELRFEIGEEYGVSLEPIPEKDLLAFVGAGQTSKSHLAELIYRQIRQNFRENMEFFQKEYLTSDLEARKRLLTFVHKVNNLTSDEVVDYWLGPDKNPEMHKQYLHLADPDIPELMKLSPRVLLEWLVSVRSFCNITLNLTRLNVADVLELLYTCEGMITHLELFNLKNYMDGALSNLEEINALQRAINDGSVVALKRIIREQLKSCPHIVDEQPDRCELFTEILRNIPKFQSYYKTKGLRDHIGSDSTSRSSRQQGMGFVFPETIPGSTYRLFHKSDGFRRVLPIRHDVMFRETYLPKRYQPLGIPLTRLIRKLPGLHNYAKYRDKKWIVDEKTATVTKENGNIATLGGLRRDTPLDFNLTQAGRKKAGLPGLFYWNTSLKNFLKVLVGFLCAVFTFQFTQSWWFLAWFGPIIWFAITGYRNILQATLGGGGIRRTPLLRWSAYLSWSRLCDSLLYTGLSVPLLEFGVRWFMLGKALKLDPVENQLIFYTLLSLVNGVYIAAHNVYRGLPKAAVIGNIFRSFLAIPVSLAYSWTAFEILSLSGFTEFVPLLYQGAAVISKLASDSVAAVVEGLADKSMFQKNRDWDYMAKFNRVFNCFSQLEVLLPEDDVLELLRTPKLFYEKTDAAIEELGKVLIVNALDLLYFWMYQPRARSTLTRMLHDMSPEELEIFAYSQMVLTRIQEVSQLFVNGLVGRNFARALAFYLNKHEEYLRDMGELTGCVLLSESEI